MSPNYNGFLFSPVTANEECSYCGVSLMDVPSLKIESDEYERYICPNCMIQIFDAVAQPEKEE